MEMEKMGFDKDGCKYRAMGMLLGLVWSGPVVRSEAEFRGPFAEMWMANRGHIR